MINEVLTPLGVPYRETMFPRAPVGDYIIYHEDVETDGPDDAVSIFTHNITVELYEVTPNPALEASLEGELSQRGLKWSKQARYWIEAAQRYQVIYEFYYITK